VHAHALHHFLPNSVLLVCGIFLSLLALLFALFSVSTLSFLSLRSNDLYLPFYTHVRTHTTYTHTHTQASIYKIRDTIETPETLQLVCTEDIIKVEDVAKRIESWLEQNRQTATLTEILVKIEELENVTRRVSRVLKAHVRRVEVAAVCCSVLLPCVAICASCLSSFKGAPTARRGGCTILLCITNDVIEALPSLSSKYHPLLQIRCPRWLCACSCLHVPVTLCACACACACSCACACACACACVCVCVCVSPIPPFSPSLFSWILEDASDVM